MIWPLSHRWGYPRRLTIVMVHRLQTCCDELSKICLQCHNVVVCSCLVAHLFCFILGAGKEAPSSCQVSVGHHNAEAKLRTGHSGLALLSFVLCLPSGPGLCSISWSLLERFE